MVNGTTQQSETVVASFGRTGATSWITGEPQDMPGLGGLLGGSKPAAGRCPHAPRWGTA